MYCSGTVVAIIKSGHDEPYVAVAPLPYFKKKLVSKFFGIFIRSGPAVNMEQDGGMLPLLSG